MAGFAEAAQSRAVLAARGDTYPYDMRHASAAVAILGAVVLLLSPLAADAAAAPCRGAGATGGQASLERLSSAVRCLINKRRHNHGAGRLDGNRRLREAAVGHSRGMVRHRFFSHTGRDGSSPATRVRRTGYLRGSDSWTVAENLSWGQGGKSRPRAVVRRWMRSSGHRYNVLLSSVRDIGVGVARGSPIRGERGGVTYTVVFARN